MSSNHSSAELWPQLMRLQRVRSVVRGFHWKNQDLAQLFLSPQTHLPNHDRLKKNFKTLKNE